MKPQSLPAGAWEVLLPRALAPIDDIQKHGGLTVAREFLMGLPD